MWLVVLIGFGSGYSQFRITPHSQGINGGDDPLPCQGVQFVLDLNLEDLVISGAFTGGDRASAREFPRGSLGNSLG